MNISKFLIIGTLVACLVMLSATPVSAKIDVTSLGFRANQGGGGKLDLGWGGGNMGNTWTEGEWVPYQLVLTKVQESYPGLVGMPNIEISYDFTTSGSRFVDLVRGLQVGITPRTDTQGWPNDSGNAYPMTTRAEIEEAQNDVGNTPPLDNTWTGFQLLNLPDNQINVDLTGGTGTTTDGERKFIITPADLTSHGIAPTANTIVIYYQLHESRTFIWSNSLQSGYDAYPTDAWGGYVYGDDPFDTDSRTGAGYVPGSSGHVHVLTLGGSQDVPIPIPETLPGIVSGMKWLDLNADGEIDGGEPPLSGWRIYAYGNIESINFMTSTLTDVDGLYSFPDLTSGTWTIAEAIDREVPAETGYAETYPYDGASVGAATAVGHSESGQAAWAWEVTLTLAAPDQADVDFGNVRFNPNISLNKSADIDDFCLNDEITFASVTYTYLVENTGDEDLELVDVSDDTCDSPSYMSGDDGDGVLNPGEIWTYQCTTVLNETTTNTADVVAYGVYTGTEVSDEDTATVTAYNIDVDISPLDATICESGEQEFCATPSLGSGNYSYSWTKDGSPMVSETGNCITVSEAGEYCVTVHDDDTGCEATACATLSVTSPPVCSILGDSSICATDTEVMFCSEYSADSYSWSIDEGGDADIVSDTDGDCVLVTPTGPGSFTLRLLVCNGPAELNCCSECTLNVTVNPCTPGIHVEKYPSIDSFCLSEAPIQVTYTYYLTTGTGDEPLETVSLEDLDCTPVRQADDPGNGDDILELDEVWVYTCTTYLDNTTTNTVDAAGYGVFSGNQVTDETTATVTAYDLYVEVTPLESEICAGGDPVELTANASEGSGNYSYLWDTGETTQSINVNVEGEYCVTVTDLDTGCTFDACANLYVIDPPDCSIEGSTSLCVGDQVQFCASVSDADIYLWEISGSDATIVGPTDQPCVTVDAGTTGSFTLTLELCYNPVGIVVAQDLLPGCCATCDLEVTVNECDTFCSFTQGFWGNPGGTGCDPGVTTTDLLIALLDATDALSAGADPVTIGQPGRSITFDTADCILLRLPAGGPPKALPDFGDKNCTELPNSLLFGDGRAKNVLIGQVVALTLNLRLYPGCLGDGADLDSFILPSGPFCTVPYGDMDACVKQSEIPEALQGITVNMLLEYANAALAGDDTYSISDIYKAVTAINEGFDECRTIVPCIRPEICNNGCDDDGDGYIDGDDSDCQPI
jgi:hypothetical protein